MGLTFVEGTVSGKKGKKASVKFLIDSGAIYTLLPEKNWKALGLKNPLTRGERRERAPLPERPETTPRARTAVGRLLDRIGGGGASAPIQRRRAREPLRPVGPIRHDAELPPVGERAASILALLDTLKRGPP